LELVPRKSFYVLAGIGTINHTRITGLVVFRYRARYNKLIETHSKNLDKALYIPPIAPDITSSYQNALEKSGQGDIESVPRIAFSSWGT
jgi:hypothetical protein